MEQFVHESKICGYSITGLCLVENVLYHSNPTISCKQISHHYSSSLL